MLKQLRKKKGLTQEELARAIGLKSGSSISKIENGHFVPSLRVALKISKLLEVPVEKLFDSLKTDKRKEDEEDGKREPENSASTSGQGN